MYDFFAQASSLHTNEQARAIKFYVEPSSVQINRASILELSVHSKCPVEREPGRRIKNIINSSVRLEHRSEPAGVRVVGRGLEDGQNGKNFILFVCPFQTPIPAGTVGARCLPAAGPATGHPLLHSFILPCRRRRPDVNFRLLGGDYLS